MNENWLDGLAASPRQRTNDFGQTASRLDRDGPVILIVEGEASRYPMRGVVKMCIGLCGLASTLLRSEQIALRSAPTLFP
ncbi:MAG TPA: hypothetical protein VF396_25915, partial [Bradyrhizobium sp.]